MNSIIKWLEHVWGKKYLELFLALALLGSIFLFYFCAQISDYLILYTLVAIIWYSRETMDLKKIASKQNDHLRIEHKTNMRPYLRLQKGGQRGLTLVNEGKGVAVNLRPVYKKGSATQEFLKIPAMAAAPGSITESFVPPNVVLELDPSVNEFTIEISYNDIEKRNYLAIFKSNTLFNDGFEIIKQEEVKV